MTGNGKFEFRGQRAEVYPFQSIFPGIGGKYKNALLYEWHFGCTVLNGKIPEITNLHIQSQAILLSFQ